MEAAPHPIDLRRYCYPKQTGLIEQVCPNCNAYIIYFWHPNGDTFAKCLMCRKTANVLCCKETVTKFQNTLDIKFPLFLQ